VQPDPTIATLGSLLAATLDLAGLLVKLPASHLLLQSASLYQLAEPTYRILYRLPIADLQLNHASLSNQTLTLRSSAKPLLPRNELFTCLSHPQFPSASDLPLSSNRGQNSSLTLRIRPEEFLERFLLPQDFSLPKIPSLESDLNSSSSLYLPTRLNRPKFTPGLPTWQNYQPDRTRLRPNRTGPSQTQLSPNSSCALASLQEVEHLFRLDPLRSMPESLSRP